MLVPISRACAADYLNVMPIGGSGSWSLFSPTTSYGPFWAPSPSIITSIQLSIQVQYAEYGNYGFWVRVYTWNGSSWVKAFEKYCANGSQYDYPLITVNFGTWTTGFKVEMQKYWGNNCSGVYWYTMNRVMLVSNYSEDQAIKASADAAKVSADAAKSSADLAASRTLYNGQSAAYWAYQAAQAANTPPVITKIQGLNGATCTRGVSFTLVVTASDNGPPSNLRYRVVCGSFDSRWLSTNQITIMGLSTPGAKTATVMVSDNPTNPDGGNIAQGSFTFFKI